MTVKKDEHGQGAHPQIMNPISELLYGILKIHYIKSVNINVIG
jgi:hypothetical protein